MGKGRGGKPAFMSRLDFHDWNGRLIDRVKCKTTEKSRGMSMIDLITCRFNFSLDEYRRSKTQQNLQDINDNMEELKKRGLFKNLSKDTIDNLHRPFRFKNNLNTDNY